MVKKTNSKKEKTKELRLPYWVRDGFNGILALVIYNFVLYLSKIAGFKGVLSQMEEITGYFYLNTIVDFMFSKIYIILGLLLVFLFAFLLGILIASVVRQIKNRKKRK